MADTMRGVVALQDELEKAKESLKDVDENIKKLTGRDPTEQRSGRRVALASESRGRERIFNQARRSIGDADGTPVKRRIIGTAFSRLGPPRGAGRGRPRADSGDEEDVHSRPTIQSSVVITPKEVRSRKDSIDEQKTDRQGNARNKRMFGLLLGTLRKFKDEAKETEDRAEQRKQIEQKLEEKANQEKEEIIKERRQLFIERRNQQAKIQRLEQKMELVDMHEEREKEMKKLSNFLRTKAKPHIFYLPKMMMPQLVPKLQETSKIVDEMIVEGRKRLEQEIEELMNEEDQEGDGQEEDDDKMEHDGDREGKFRDQTDKENRGHRRRLSDERESQRKSNEFQSRRKSNEGDSKNRRDVDSRKSHDLSKGNSGGDRGRKRSASDRKDSYDESHKRRRSHTEDDKHEGSGKNRRKSDGDGKSGRDRDRHHKSGRRDSHKVVKTDDMPREVRLDYDDEEIEEGEVTMEVQPVSQDSGKKEDNDNKVQGTQKEVSQEEGKDLKNSQDVNLERNADFLARERKVVMAEDAEDGEEGELQDAVDE